AFETEAGVMPVVDGVSFRVPRGQTVALVGESGCGKSVTALSVMRLIPQPPGRILDGEVLLRETPNTAPIDLLRISERQMQSIRGNRIAMVFQEPATSLNPVFSIGEQIVEAIELHQSLHGRRAWTAAVESLRRVGIRDPERRARDFPHQLSGGMLQRAMIAMALSCHPQLLIADEPTTALDTTVQLQILELLRELQAESGMSILLITHDLGVVAEIAYYVYVMYAGQIVEHAAVDRILSRPLHPYTQGLLCCLPRMDRPGQRLEGIPGSVPDPRDFPAGCRFHPRCGVGAACALRQNQPETGPGTAPKPVALGDYTTPCPGRSESSPVLQEVEPGHFVACVEAGMSRSDSESGAGWWSAS
ncbi:MAG: ABC transporter ATP-binding protein, partial [Planctomycetes bacterium]|nr:ABC transporter ATP-binding protein [Planctomycetota bacterium]